MNTYASQHPADKTPLYEPVHASDEPITPPKRVLHHHWSSGFELGSEAFSNDGAPATPERKRIAVAHVFQ